MDPLYFEVKDGLLLSAFCPASGKGEAKLLVNTSEVSTAAKQMAATFNVAESLLSLEVQFKIIATPAVIKAAKIDGKNGPCSGRGVSGADRRCGCIFLSRYGAPKGGRKRG